MRSSTRFLVASFAASTLLATGAAHAAGAIEWSSLGSMYPLPGTAGPPPYVTPSAIAICPNGDLLVLTEPVEDGNRALYMQSPQGGQGEPASYPLGPTQGGFTYVTDVPQTTVNISCSAAYTLVGGPHYVYSLWLLTHEGTDSQVLYAIEPWASHSSFWGNPDTFQAGTPGYALGLAALTQGELYVLNDYAPYYLYEGTGANASWTHVTNSTGADVSLSGATPGAFAGEATNGRLFVANRSAANGGDAPGLFSASLSAPGAWSKIQSYLRTSPTESDLVPNETQSIAVLTDGNTGDDYVYALTANDGAYSLYYGLYVP
jgi:hypothetical protein